MASFTEIAEGILANARRLDEFTASKGLTPSTFENHTLNDLPEEIEACRKDLVDATHTLKRLALGPVGQFMEMLFFVSGTNFEASCGDSMTALSMD